MSSESSRQQHLVSARGVGKCYHMYAEPRHRLMQTLWRGKRQFYKEFWALRGVDFDLPRGQSLGIVGRNGSGKSTLLQIIAGTLAPTQGEIAISGRVGALLELGSGFNMDYTGRDNVFMSAAIMGFSPAQTAERYDEIVAFADIGDFVDQPVKTYSSGMFIRLAFALQVLMDPDVLIVDEALAVGDAAFQFKCLARMKRLLDKGTSVILVTHDVQTIRTMCHQAIWLKDGKVEMAGDPAPVTTAYMRYIFDDQAVAPVSLEASHAEERARGMVLQADDRDDPAAAEGLTVLSKRPELMRWGSGEGLVEALRFGPDGDQIPVFEHGQEMQLEVQLRVRRDWTADDIGFAFSLRNTKGLDVVCYTTYDQGMRLPRLRAGQRIRLKLSWANILAPGDYVLIVAIERVTGGARSYLDFVENAAIFKCVAPFSIFSPAMPEVSAVIVDANRPGAGGSATVAGDRPQAQAAEDRLPGPAPRPGERPAQRQARRMP